MKKSFSRTMKTLVFSAMAAVAFAQGDQKPDLNFDKAKVGIGVAVGQDFSFASEGLFLPASFSNIYVPIISRSLKVEPEFGIWRLKSTWDGGKSSTSVIRLGLGLFPYTQKGRTIIYYGGRFGINLFADATDMDGAPSNQDDSKQDFFLGAAVGGEHFFSNNFSLGGEVQLNYVSIGEYDSDSDDSNSLISNRALIALRYYF